MQFTIGGLPAHPLIVHAVVVLIPLSALGAVAVAFHPVWNRPYAPLVASGAVASAVAGTLAKIAGDELLIAIRPTPEYGALLAEHGQFGLYTIFASWVFAVLAVATAVLGRRGAGPVRAASAVSALIGLVALVLVVITGDLGATSVWGSLTGVAP
jgi:uncharacterized membrane protein